ncbi:MAG: hypothetical protein KKD33_07960, partial [Verrucomicrobia bacterium]|nr:hypothetical protein [Verrucomicrobiota bacterium]
MMATARLIPPSGMPPAQAGRPPKANGISGSQAAGISGADSSIMSRIAMKKISLSSILICISFFSALAAQLAGGRRYLTLIFFGIFLQIGKAELSAPT